MSNLARALSDALFGIVQIRHAFKVTNADRRTLADLGVSGEAAQRARFNAFRVGEPGASYAARLGVNGR